MADRDLELKIRALVEGAKDVDELKKGLRDLSGQKVGDNTRKMRQGFDKSERSADNLRRTTQLATRALGVLGLAFGAAQVAQFAQRTLEGAENTTRLADSVGATISTVQELTFTFKQYRLEQNDVADALATLSDRAEDAKAGTSSMIEDFGLLGISVDDLRGKDPGELFRLFAEGVKNTEDPGKRLAGVVRTMGDDLGRNLLPLLLEGEEGLRNYAQQARDAGAVMGDELTRGGADANRELREIRQVISADFARTVVENTDAITDFAKALGTLASWAATATAETTSFIKFLAEDLASDLFGPAADDIVRIEEKIKKLREGLEKPLLMRGTHGGEDFFASDEEINAEIKKLEALRDLYRDRQFNKRFGGDGDDDTGGTGGTGGTDPGGESDEEAEKRQNKIQAIIDKLKEQQATYGQSAQAAAIYRLELLGASEAEIEQARSIAESIEQQRQSEQAQKDAAKAARELAEEKRRNVEADKELLATMRQEIELAGLSNRERAQQIAVSRLSVEATDEQRRAVEKLAGKLFDLKEAGEEAGDDMNEFAKQAARNMQSAFADYLYDPFDEGLEGMVRGFADAVRRMLAEALAAKALQSFFGGISGATTGGTSSFFGAMAANVQHTGGMAGTGPTRQVSPLLFIGARRYHEGGMAGMAGLAPDEVPAILQRGERVMSRSEVQQSGQQQGAMPSGRLQVELGDGLVGRVIRSDEGQQALIELVRRNRSAFNQALS